MTWDEATWYEKVGIAWLGFLLAVFLLFVLAAILYIPLLAPWYATVLVYITYIACTLVSVHQTRLGKNWM